MNPEAMVAEALQEKGRPQVFERLAVGALDHHRMRSRVSTFAVARSARGTRAGAKFF